MDNFIVSARKYRPPTFEEVVGQDSITTTLKNAIKNNHLAQAYLFCGPRGVGKTTCARIFAKTINCKNLNDNVEPCNECDACNAFNLNRSYNIHELDAASNNSVDDIRNLIEQVRIPPQVGNYNIYIIDEVHMLSQSAFNAFLKTLEEPPKHAIFILATTEKHKIIPTILSRCQIFDFNRIKIDDAVTYLAKIAGNEKIDYEVDALNIIAQKADGAMRDALSIFDQVVSFSGKNITYQNVIDNLNILDYDYYFKITDAFIQNNVSETLITFNEILDNGFDGHHFINSLSEHLRNLLVSQDPATIKLLETGENIKAKYAEQSKYCEKDLLLSALEITNNCDVTYKISRNKRLHIELALVKLCNISDVKKKIIDNKVEEKKASSSKTKDVSQEKSQVTPRPESIKRETTDTVKPRTEEMRQPEKQPPTGSDIKSISIKELTNKKSRSSGNEAEDKDTDDQVDSDDHYQDNDFDKNDLRKAWLKFSESVKQKPRIYNTMKSKEPVIDKDQNIIFDIDNPLQEEKINEVKNDLLIFLRKELQNAGIDLILNIKAEQEETNNKLYTAEDKFRHMAEKNENLKKLKQDFNLDFE